MAPARRPTAIKQVRTPADLAGPVKVALAKSVDQIPGPRAMPGGSRYEVKWDGYLNCISEQQKVSRADGRTCGCFRWPGPGESASLGPGPKVCLRSCGRHR